MPTYEFVCVECDKSEEKILPIEDRDLISVFCPRCGYRMTRAISNSVGVQFKGSGFYKTDNG